MKRSAWIKPKTARKRMMQRILQCHAHLIFCLRAQDKIDFVKDDKGKTKAVPMQTATGYKGWIPICDARFPFELTASFIMLPDKPGVPVPIKIQEQHKAFFPTDRPVSEESGRQIAQWAAGGGSQVATLTDDDIRDIETICQDSGVPMVDVTAQLVKQGYANLASVPKDKGATLTAWIKSKAKKSS